MDLIVIHERDHDDNERSVIGVAESVPIAELLIKEYYGAFKEVSFKDIRESNLEYEKVIEIPGDNILNDDKCTITLEWFKLNEV